MLLLSTLLYTSFPTPSALLFPVTIKRKPGLTGNPVWGSAVRRTYCVLFKLCIKVKLVSRFTSTNPLQQYMLALNVAVLFVQKYHLCKPYAWLFLHGAMGIFSVPRSALRVFISAPVCPRDSTSL